MMIHERIDTPVGALQIAADAAGLRYISFEPAPSGPSATPADGKRSRGGEGPRDSGGGHRHVREAQEQLRAYFAGELRQFDLTLAPRGTPFQLQVWQTLARIPYGETISYAELAEWIHRPRACRAVGAANGKNPLPIVLPCHRVIGKNGDLTGYGGGLARKRDLLCLERESSGAETLSLWDS